MPSTDPAGAGIAGPAGSVAPRVVFAGGGPSCASILAHMAEQLDPARAPGARGWEMVLVDRAGEAGGGGPHAAGVSQALLLNDDVAEIDSSGLGLRGWLAAHRPRWFGALAGDPDPRVARWVRTHRAEVAAGEFDRLFLPRAVFGTFMRERVATARDRLAAAGVTVHVRAGDIVAARPGPPPHPWRVSIATGTRGAVETVPAGAVVLGLGNLTAAPPPALAAHPRYLIAGRACDPDAVEALRDRLDRRRRDHHEPARIAVLGASAAASEFLYCVEGSPAFVEACAQVTVIAPSGRLADGLPSAPESLRDRAPFVCDAVRTVTGEPGLTSGRLVAALGADVTRGRAGGLRTADMLREIEAAFAPAFGGMAATEKRRFVERDVAEFRRLTRHTSTDYDAAAIRLDAAGKLAVRAGVVDAVTLEGGTLHSGAPGGGTFRVLLAGGGTIDADAVVDCRGFAGVHDGRDPVVDGLVRDATVRVNASGRGLVVDEHFQAAPGLFVMGPLLAGTSQGADHIWYLENIARIYALSARCAAEIWRQLSGARGGAGSGIGVAVEAGSR